MYIKPKDMFNLIEVAQDALTAIDNGERVPTEEEFILIRDALIEANKMRIALDRIEKIHSESCSSQLARNALKLIEY